MVRDFYTEASEFLTAQGAVRSGEWSTPFPVYSFLDHKLHIHLLSVKSGDVHTSDPSFFAGLIKEATQKEQRIIHLWEDMWIHHLALVQERIRTLLGLRRRIHARQTQVVRLDKEQTDLFLKMHHLQGTTGAYYKFGLMFGDELVAVATFSKSRVMHDGPVYYRSYELERFASVAGVTVTGGLGKLLNHFIEQYEPAHLMTYADGDWSNGEGYQKLGFDLVERTASQFFQIHPHELLRLYPHRLKESPGELSAKGYRLICNSGNLKFVMDRRGIEP